MKNDSVNGERLFVPPDLEVLTASRELVGTRRLVASQQEVLIDDSYVNLRVRSEESV